MDCNIFNKNLMAYIEKDLPYNVRQEMRQHIEECEACRAAYEKKLFTREQFSEIFSNDQVFFSSVSTAVMNNINNDKYEIGFFKKLSNHFKKLSNHFKSFAGGYVALGVMVAFVIIIVPRMGGMAKKESMSMKNSTENKAESNGLSKTIITSLPEDKSDLWDTENNLNENLNDIKTRELGVGPWMVVYSDKDIIYFYNYSHLLVYNNSSKEKSISNAVNLMKLDVGSYQGSSVVHFIPSTKGKMCAIGNLSPELDMKDVKKNLYIFNVEKNKLKPIGKGNLAMLHTGWSNLSQYFVYADKSGERVTVYDSVKEENNQIAFNRGEIKSIYISDNGDVLINSNKIYLLRKENLYTPVELEIPGVALGFKDKEIVYYSEGIIYLNDLKNSKEINRIGKDYMLDEKVENNILFKNDKMFKVYDSLNNEFYEYSNEYINNTKRFSPNYKSFFDNYDQYVKIINCNGTVKEFKDSPMPFEYNWMDDNTLISVPFKEGAKYLGDFIIKKLDISTGKESIIFEMK